MINNGNNETFNLIKKSGFDIRKPYRPMNYDEPFGAILWRRRTDMNYPICLVSGILGFDSPEKLAKMEMGWYVPYDDYMETMVALATLYGWTYEEYKTVSDIGIKYRDSEPIDLSHYLGFDIPEHMIEFCPGKVYPISHKPSIFKRLMINVESKVLAGGHEVPTGIIWNDGRIFPVDRIDSAREKASFLTGGIGTLFSCWFKGRQRNLCCEAPGQWFVESPVM